MAEHRDLREEFERHYPSVTSAPMVRAERSVIGADYGATSYTTRSEADLLASLLALSPDSRLLDIGSGSGWPGIYIAAATGSRVTLTDLPLPGLRIASDRARADGLADRVTVVCADGSTLPFAADVFDAVTSSDVFC